MPTGPLRCEYRWCCLAALGLRSEPDLTRGVRSGNEFAVGVECKASFIPYGRNGEQIGFVGASG